MKIERTLLASALLLAFHPAVRADDQEIINDGKIQQVVVTASPLRNGEGDQILTPAKVLAGDELRDKVGSSLGETLQNELGVSASAFGAGASRPIIRGMEGSRVKMLENGMATSDVSGLSNDHAVASEGAIARQIEILRGPAALLYGSGAIGGLVNVVNERIPTALEPKLTGQVETRLSTVDNGKDMSGTLDGSIGKIGLHLDGNARNTDDYQIPDLRVVNDPTSRMNRLPNSDTKERNIGIGGSYIDDWGYAGLSASHLTNFYGIPTDEGSHIDQRQNRYDFDSVVKNPLAGLESARVKAGYTDYHHAELDDGVPATLFSNKSFESRVELTHKPITSLGLHGTFGVQTENTHFSALSAAGGPDTVPVTHSTTQAAFLVEEWSQGPLRWNAGLRYENVDRKPVSNRERTFDLGSGSIGALWPFTKGYSAGATVSYAQRAPATEELYSGGPHDATLTFDVGDPNLQKEVSRNIELSLQKTSGLLRWRVNAYRNNVNNFIYGHIMDASFDEDGNPGGEFRQRLFQQAKAHVQGAEAEMTWNQIGMGWNGRVFADTSRGYLDDAGNLPLQPADRVGAAIGYRQPHWRAGLDWTHARGQDRLAAFETSTTPSYNQVNANVSYTQRLEHLDLTYFVTAKNLLNEDIRLATSLLKDIAPLPGRNVVFGVRAKF
ncbi:TonB-dependent receptor [Massilia sp. Root133]|uniref:TonB-dependent receptor n=1 Tax=Massilia cellulosiltytica TaxID=2683234 RepID=A0A7X3K9H8_9BURK|nr:MULTISPECIES: TonB-dependent receptor [Telluria group]KQY01716.1 TonB-dependent receptor [Massilia sp. Root133]KQZ38795.1 TonB-dependent receptor [Massilia sp. Root1485]MVW62567.1 TonB-dependent receptor [Telluria cellulosilytica]